jgi:hypothetical protein
MALSIIERINKRAFYPLRLVNGETIHLRAVRNEHREAVQDFKDKEESVGYLIGMAVVSDNGDPEFVQAKEESALAFGERVLALISEIGPDVREQIVKKIFQISNEPSSVQMEAIVKN